MIQERLEQVIKNLQALEQSVDSRSVAKGILADIETLKDISQSLVTNPGYRLVRVDDENSFLFPNLQQQAATAHVSHLGVVEDCLVLSRDGALATRFKPLEQRSEEWDKEYRDQEIKEIIDSFKFIVKAVWHEEMAVQPDKNKTTGDRSVDVAQFVKDTLEKVRFATPRIYMKSLNEHGVEKVNRICTSFVYNAISAVAMSFISYYKLAAYIYDFNCDPGFTY